MSSSLKSNNILNVIKWTLALSAFLIAVVGNNCFRNPFLYRVLGVLGLFIIGLAILATTEFGRNSLRLMFESRTELRRSFGLLEQKLLKRSLWYSDQLLYYTSFFGV